MTQTLDGSRPAQGLRERKKAKTRVAVQRHALRLFKEQGYDNTTVEQIADAAEISPSTFFRYFPTKEDVVLYDAMDPILIAEFEAQPAELSPIQAMRRAIRGTFSRMPAEAIAEQRERIPRYLEAGTDLGGSRSGDLDERRSGHGVLS